MEQARFIKEDSIRSSSPKDQVDGDGNKTIPIMDGTVTEIKEASEVLTASLNEESRR